MAKTASPNKQLNDSQEKKERTSMYLLPTMQQQIKYICLKEKVFQNDIVEKALSEYIKRWEKENGQIPL